tara:strand:- start:1863 stop:2855 length:993 start_codon:yes stop_codon:yes gene_type:complete
MKPKLSDIAKKAKLSVATVSRILRKKNLKNKPNEIKVLKIAREIGYPYIQLHKDQNKKKKIALILKMEKGEFYPSLFNGIHNASLATDLQLSLISVKKNKKNYISEIIDIINEFYASIIFLPFLTQNDYSYIQKRTIGKKLISLAPIPDPVVQTISFDSYRGGYLMAKYFFDSGFNEVGLITGPSKILEANYRKNGFLDYTNSNHSINLKWIYSGDYSAKSGHEAFQNYLINCKKNIAVFSCNDSMAFGFIKEAIEHGISIPKDLKIAGYDNLPTCKEIIPSLSSINTDYNLLGKLVIKSIISSDPHETDQIGYFNLLPVELKKRNSTAV